MYDIMLTKLSLLLVRALSNGV